MKPIRLLPYVLSIMLLFIMSCVKDEIDEFTPNQEEQPNPNVSDIRELKIPDQFDFSTHKELDISVSDTTSHARYSIKSNDETIFTGFIVENELAAKIKVAIDTEELTLMRNANFKQETFAVSISGTQLFFEYPN